MRNAFVLLLAISVPALADVPENLDRAAISAGVAKIKPKILACASDTPGMVKLEVAVAAHGRVTNVTVKATPEQALGECAAAAMKQATFRATQKGGSFSYPFMFGSKAESQPAPPANSDALDRAAISEGIAKVKPDIAACGKSSAAKGSVKVKVDVAPEGNVARVEVTTTPDAPLGACVASAVQKATFKKTTKGGSFSYPFVF
jgi:outer membrane biosynthesis protein TonB